MQKILEILIQKIPEKGSTIALFISTHPSLKAYIYKIQSN